MSKQPSGLLRRLGAIIYDALLTLALIILTIIVFTAFNGFESIEPGDPLHRAMQLSIALVSVAFFVGFWSTKGRTLGMQSWGLQLETPEGERVSVAAATIRYFAAILSWAVVGIGFLWQLVDRDKLTWHDRLSNTRLVHYPKEKKS